MRVQTLSIVSSDAMKMQVEEKSEFALRVLLIEIASLRIPHVNDRYCF